MLTTSSVFESTDLSGSGPWMVYAELTNRFASTPHVSFTTTVTPEDDDAEFVINESTAASFGGDWADVVEWSQGLLGGSSNHTRVVRGYVDDPENINRGGSIVEDFFVGWPAQHELVSYTPESLTLIFQYNVNGMTNQQTGRIRWVLVGDGLVVPEPCSLLILITGCPMFGRRWAGRCS